MDMKPNNPGRTSRSIPHYDPGMFSNVQSVDDFAAVLQVPKESISLINPLINKKCSSKTFDCPFDPLIGNGGYCCVHSRQWYPLLGKDRGSNLHGPEFVRGGVGGRKFRVCDCNQPSCFAAGYFPNQEPIYIRKAGVNTVLSQTGLLSSETKAKVKSGGELYLYPWHFFPQHLIKENGIYKLNLQLGTYKDLESKTYNYPPPRGCVDNFIKQELLNDDYVSPQQRWSLENTKTHMPNWMQRIMDIDASMDISKPSTITPAKTKKTKKITHRSTEKWEARARLLEQQMLEQAEKHARVMADLVMQHSREMKEQKDKYEQQLVGMKRKYDDISEEYNKQTEKISQLEEKNSSLEEELKELRQLLEEIQSSAGRPLRYDDLKSGGLLSKHVRAFTLFDTYEQNEAFLNILNFADGTPGSFKEGDGLCENLRQYSKVQREERSGEEDAPTMDGDSKEYKQYINRSKGNSKSDRTWKDDYLTWCIYVRAGCTSEFVSTLCDVSDGGMSDILREWAYILDDALQRWFPIPTRSQMLRAYPDRFIEADGHGRCFLLLDAFELFCQQSSNPNVASSTHSDYKKHCTIKFLGGCDIIGCPWADTVTDGYPGRASDVLMTTDTEILRPLPFGSTVKVDKGFIINNEAKAEGVDVDRPQKRRKKQVQQSSADTSQTQKIGNTRIIVENVNGGLKLQIRYLNALIPTLQFGLVSKIVRIGYLLQNFKKAIIQDISAGDMPNGKRPCRAEVRWYGAIDVGLRDIRDNVHLWGLKCEIARHAELWAMEEHRNKSATEISEMVLDEKWDVKMKEALVAIRDM